MASLTVHLPASIKQKAFKKAKKDGVTFTFIVNQAFQAYIQGEINFRLISDKNDDEEITASFDVSTAEGKKKCLESFKKLAQCKK